MCTTDDTDPGLFDSSLEPPESKSQNGPGAMWAALPEDMELAERFRHSGWQRNRTLIYHSLRRTMQSVSRIMAFDSCGSAAYVYKRADDDAKFMLGGSSCRDRMCLPCQQDRSRVLATNVLDALKDKPSRFLTLTLKQTDASLSEQLDRLYSCFSKLRQRAFWKKHVVGGCAFFEIVYKPDVGRWNVHVHCIVHGSYMPQRELSSLWYKITGDSHIVDICFIRDANIVGRYVVKYVGKPFNNSFLNRPERLDEVIQALKKRRLCITFGDWRGVVLTRTVSEHDWISLGSFHDVASKAVDGDEESMAAMVAVCGENYAAILDRVKNARPPPITDVPWERQAIFEWPAVDPRF